MLPGAMSPNSIQKVYGAMFSRGRMHSASSSPRIPDYAGGPLTLGGRLVSGLANDSPFKIGDVMLRRRASSELYSDSDEEPKIPIMTAYFDVPVPPSNRGLTIDLPSPTDSPTGFAAPTNLESDRPTSPTSDPHPAEPQTDPVASQLHDLAAAAVLEIEQDGWRLPTVDVHISSPLDKAEVAKETLPVNPPSDGELEKTHNKAVLDDINAPISPEPQITDSSTTAIRSAQAFVQQV